MKMTLNVGCGNRTYSEYPEKHMCINYDIRSLQAVDVIGDVCSLPFPDSVFDYILASDIVEHFPLTQTKRVLKEWTRVLKKGGWIEFRLPNLRAICEKYVKGEHSARLTSWLLYGGQDYAGNFHYVGFDRAFFKEVTQEAGLREEYYTEEDNNFVMGMSKGGITMTYDSTEDTKKHIKKVKEYGIAFTFKFAEQVAVHDESKLHSPEKEAFDRMKVLSDVEYASDEYKRTVEENRPAIQHHYEHNRHHPEHFEAGTWDMSLINILEMLCDWKASTLRSKNGDIRRSIRIQAEKHEMSDELMSILLNTVDEMGW